MVKRTDLSWIRGALRSEIQKKEAEADDAYENGQLVEAANLRRIASQWNILYENSRDEK